MDQRPLAYAPPAGHTSWEGSDAPTGQGWNQPSPNFLEEHTFMSKPKNFSIVKPAKRHDDGATTKSATTR
jgi:hypothetical protein